MDGEARHLPDWLLRDWSLRFARQWRWAIEKLHDVPFAAAQAEHVSGQARFHSPVPRGVAIFESMLTSIG